MNTLHSLFTWTLDVSLRASLLAGAVLCLQAALRGHISARWRYAMWLPVLLVLVLPVLPQSRWSVENLFVKRAAPPVAMASPVVVTNTLAAPMHAPVVMPAPSISRASVIASLWAIGVCVSVASGMGLYLATMRRFKRSAATANPSLISTVRCLASQLKLRRMPEVIVSAEVESPAVAGLLRPVLLLPANFDQRFTPEEVRLVLKHELMHLKRHDLPMNALICLVHAIHWFNPVIWLAAARARLDRESACDAQVLASDERDCRSDYGNALLKVQASCQTHGFCLGLVGIVDSHSAVRSRITAIASYRPVHPMKGLLAAAMIICLGALGATRAETPPSFEIGATSFPGGDAIHIASVNRSDSLIAVSGDYELVSQDEASLAFYITATDKEHARSKTEPQQHIAVKKGKGTFTLVNTHLYPGLLHVSFYPIKGGESFGGIYFGTKEEAEASERMKSNPSKAGAKPTSNSSTSKTNTTPSATSIIEAKLKSIIFPHVLFHEATIEEVIEFLRLKSHDLDKAERDPSKKGINLIYRAPTATTKPAAKITLELKDASLFDVLRYSVELAGCHWKIEPFAVVVSALNASATANEEANIHVNFPNASLETIAAFYAKLTDRNLIIPPEPTAEQIKIVSARSLTTAEAIAFVEASILLNGYTITSVDSATSKLTRSSTSKTSTKPGPFVIPSVLFNDATLTEAVDFIRAKSSEVDPDKKGANIVLKPGAEATGSKITLSLKNIPVEEALKYCTELTGTKLEVSDSIFVIGARDTK